MQRILESADLDLEVCDLQAVPSSCREVESQRLIDEFMLWSVDLASDALFGARLLKLTDERSVLLLAMEHIISDGFSLSLFLQQVLEGYSEAVDGRVLPPPVRDTQFADFVTWQRKTEKEWLEKHSPYWATRLAGCQRLRFREDSARQLVAQCGWGVAPLRIGSKLKQEFSRLCRSQHTTLAMGFFTAYSAFALNWCDARESIVQFQINGRDTPEWEETIGPFASVLYLHMSLRDENCFVSFVEQTLNEYFHAFEHADSSYIAAQLSRPEFTRNTCFNWLPKGPSKVGRARSRGSEGPLTHQNVPFVHPMIRDLRMDSEPIMVMSDVDDEVAGNVYFPRDRLSIETMKGFCQDFVNFIELLPKCPEACLVRILRESDGRTRRRIGQST